jgi:hypothetical protein
MKLNTREKVCIGLFSGVVIICALYMYYDSTITDRDYQSKPSNDKFKRLVVVIAEDDDIADDSNNKSTEEAVKRSIQAVLGQTIKVDEIATCRPMKDKLCNQVSRHYSDPFGIGIIKSAFARELDKRTGIAFINPNANLAKTDLENAIAAWSPDNPVVDEHGITVLNYAQVSAAV